MPLKTGGCGGVDPGEVESFEDVLVVEGGAQDVARGIAVTSAPQSCTSSTKRMTIFSRSFFDRERYTAKRIDPCVTEHVVLLDVDDFDGVHFPPH